MNIKGQYIRRGILFAIGCAALIVEIVNTSIFNHSPHSAILVLGLTLCGVTVTNIALGKMKNGSGT